MHGLKSSAPDGLLETPADAVPDALELRTRLATLDGGFLLPLAVHLTGDTTLVDRYLGALPTPKVRSFFTSAEDGEGGDSDAGRADQAHEELTDLIVEALTGGDQAPFLTGQDLVEAGLFGKLAHFVSGGAKIDESEYGMYLQQAGFELDRVSPRDPQAADRSLKVAIIGAGMGGIDAAVKAAQRGFEYDIFEMEDGIGGLWWSQRYPGVAVDTPSLVYSLSWNQTADWSRIYPKGEEYRDYLSEVATKLGVADHVHLGHRVISVVWIDEQQVWELTVFDKKNAETKKVRANAVLSAAGLLNRPKYPDLDGRQEFQGEQVHTVRWREGMSFKGKRVAVVGAGAAAVQVISNVAREASELTVFQRQPHWVSPNPYGAGETTEDERWLMMNVPFAQYWLRLTALLNANKFARATNEVDADWFQSHQQSINAGSEALRQVCLEYIDKVFGLESEMGQKLTPKFSFGAKRPVWDPGDFNAGTGYYWALSQPHVHLNTSALAYVAPNGLVTADGTLTEVDVIIWATGMTLDYMSQIRITGRDGRTLNQVWDNGEDPRAYLGCEVPGFPNLFITDGPNSGVANGGGGHNFIVEVTNHYAMEALTMMLNGGAAAVEVSQEAYDRHTALVEQRQLDLIFHHDRSADTYYRNRAGRIVLVSPFWPAELWNLTRRAKREDHVLSGYAAPALTSSRQGDPVHADR
jgi:cation diffusion facilitator CzcD-associated flavoprotein CzcO